MPSPCEESSNTMAWRDRQMELEVCNQAGRDQSGTQW